MTPVPCSAALRAVKLLRAADAPALLVGTGARAATGAVGALAKRLGAPVLTTPEAKSQIDETGSDSAGVFSFGASDTACSIVRSADLVLALGTDLGEFASRGGRAYLGKTVIQVVDDPRDVATGVIPDIVIVGEIVAVVRYLTTRIPEQASPARWFGGILDAAEAPGPPGAETADTIAPGAAISAIDAALPPACRIACDVTSGTLWVLRQMRLAPNRRLWTNIEKSACMGSALGTGIGLRLASGLPTVVLIGDWGFMMGSSELHTVASLGIGNLAIVVWSNGGGALIRSGVRAQGIDAPIESHTWAEMPRFELVAKGYGVDATTVRTAAVLKSALIEAFRSPRPVLIDAHIDPNATVPAGDRYLHLDASVAAR